MLVCPGGKPILEIPEKGRWIFERLTPGTIREEDYYEEFRTVPGGRPGSRLLVACPRGQTHKGRCRAGQRVLRIWHLRRRIESLVRDCKSGRLSRRRAGAIRRIEEDIKALRRGKSVEGLLPMFTSTGLGRLGQFILSAVVGTMISVAVLKVFFPGVFAPAPIPTLPNVPKEGLEGEGST